MGNPRQPRIYRHFTIMTATRDGFECFETIEEMPAVLRATCLKALDDEQTSTTFVIASRSGLEALQSFRQNLQPNPPPTPAPASPPSPSSWFRVRFVLEILVLGAISLACWLLVSR